VAVLCAVLFRGSPGGRGRVSPAVDPGRSMEFFDWVADFVGGVDGSLTARRSRVAELPFLLSGKIPPFGRYELNSHSFLAFDIVSGYVVAFEALNSMGVHVKILVPSSRSTNPTEKVKSKGDGAGSSWTIYDGR